MRRKAAYRVQQWRSRWQRRSTYRPGARNHARPEAVKHYAQRSISRSVAAPGAAAYPIRQEMQTEVKRKEAAIPCNVQWAMGFTMRVPTRRAQGHLGRTDHPIQTHRRMNIERAGQSDGAGRLTYAHDGEGASDGTYKHVASGNPSHAQS